MPQESDANDKRARQLPSSGEITALLRSWEEGEEGAIDELMASTYEELRKTARGHLAGSAGGNTLQPTALINETYLRLANGKSFSFNSRSQFYAFASQLMRHILVEYVRARFAQKRGSGQANLSLDEPGIAIADRQDIDFSTLLSLDTALARLDEMDSRKRQIVEMRFFAGLEINEIAEILDCSASTIKREWRFAKRWLASELQDLNKT
ncbi:MAG: ECF-type sigma factor [Acidobacteriota bacterium]|nr:ECF-type sigma factor [Acidobacteriota bacterium]